MNVMDLELKKEGPSCKNQWPTYWSVVSEIYQGISRLVSKA